MEEGKKKSNVLLVVVILLVLLVIVLVAGMLYLYKEIQSLKSSDNVTTVDKEVTNIVSTNNDGAQKEDIKDKQEVVRKELDVDDELVQKAYKFVPTQDNLGLVLSAYQKSKIEFNDLPNKMKLVTIFNNIDFSKEQDSISPYVENGNEMWEWWYFDEELLEKYAKKYYGENANITHETFDLNFAAACSYKDNMHRYLYSKGGGGVQSSAIREIEDAYIEEDNLYIIDKYLFVEGVEGSERVSHYNVYKNSVGDILDVIDDEEELTKLEGIDLEDHIKANYGDRMTEYKHTFKLSDDGNYYWVCSEPNN